MSNNKPKWYGKACLKLCADRDFTLSRCKAICIGRAREIYSELQQIKSEAREVADELAIKICRYRCDGNEHDKACEEYERCDDMAMVRKLRKIGGGS